MVGTDWLLDSMALDTASRLVDGLLAVGLLAAIALGWLTGLSPVVLSLLVLAAFALEHAVAWVTRRRLLETVETTGSVPDQQLRDLVAGLADRMEMSSPRIVVDESVGSGVSVLESAHGPVLLLSRSVCEDLDDAALTGVIAHELAHLDRNHIGRLDSREPIAHVVGATVFWVAVGQHLGPVLSLVGLATYVGAGVFRAAAVPQLYYLCASLGVVLLALGLIGIAHRLQEHQADDRAVALTDTRSFCRGLVRVTATPESRLHRDDLAGPASERRGLLARATATHPRLDRRLARYGCSVDDLVDESDV